MATGIDAVPTERRADLATLHVYWRDLGASRAGYYYTFNGYEAGPYGSLLYLRQAMARLLEDQLSDPPQRRG